METETKSATLEREMWALGVKVAHEYEDCRFCGDGDMCTTFWTTDRILNPRTEIPLPSKPPQWSPPSHATAIPHQCPDTDHHNGAFAFVLAASVGFLAGIVSTVGLLASLF